ncbi:putative lysine-specific histone demethylase 1A [Coniochaeta sp. 2T2.1]|nr:putative lysine-specific histone demethylase 1A [Coniochaeta sp. 2T2.1]
MAPHVGFDTDQIRDKARKDLLYLLEGVRGKKNLIIEESLAGPVGAIVTASTLRDYGVEKFFFLEKNHADASQRNVIFIARGDSEQNVQAIADVLSLELDDSFKDLYLSKDPTSIFLLARALMGIQQKHGLFPRIIGKGDNAKRVAELLSRMRQELLAGEDANEAGKIGLTPSTTTESLIIIDREVDFVTPLLTQLTYEGLIDEMFGIQNNQTDVDSTIIGAPAQQQPQQQPQGTAAAPAANPQGRTRKIQLDSADKLFEQIRDTNFAVVGNILGKVARRLKTDLDSRHQSHTTAELREFVTKLPALQTEQQSLKTHIALAEEIKKKTQSEEFGRILEVQQNLAAGADPSSQFDVIEELIARDTPLPEVLRLLCIYSTISGGIKAKEFDLFRRLVLEGYGYQHILTLQNLEKLQLFLSRSSPLASMIPMTAAAGATGTKTNYTYLRKQLRLINDEVKEHDPNDIAYKQFLLRITKGNGVTNAAGSGGAQGWRGFEDAVKHARGQTFDELQKGEDKAVKARALLSGNSEKKTVFVVFVGGITFTEIAALRFIAKEEAVSDNSRLSSPLSTLSSKATTPVDNDSSRELPPQPPPPVPIARARDIPRRKYDVRPKVSIPNDLGPNEYAEQCIAAAESSRLNPWALHEEEYAILRDHISHAQVTTYLNIRNGILRLWVRNPQIAVTREEAIGCAKDSRWFDVANVSYEWLVRRGYINFGCVEIKSSKRSKKTDPPTKEKRKTIVVIGAGMSGLSCARQLEGLAKQYQKKFREMGEELPQIIVLEGRDRIGGRVYSRAFKTKPAQHSSGLPDKRFTAEMGGMIITGFEKGNPLNILVRGQLGLPYHNLLPETTIYDSNGKPVDQTRDMLVEQLFNACLDRVSEFKFKSHPQKLIEGNRDLIDEGKDSSSEASKTIAIVEETTAAQPHAPPVSEQNIAPQVDLVPVSSDRLTGRVHVEPGTPGAVKAAYKAKLLGWALKPGVTEEHDVSLEEVANKSGATLGSVTDDVISQFKDIVDLTPQDFRLINWHVANLEYSNAINYNQLSLPGWDIDAGNEWEGKHSMIIGGYQSVPRGLMLSPTRLDVRRKAPVTAINYSPDSSYPALVQCEDGSTIQADYVVSTIPLGVLKHNNISFAPPLPSWKSSAISRLGYGVLNKVILVYPRAFWDEARDIFGVLRNPRPNRHSLNQADYSSQRGRFFQWFNISHTSGLPCLLALMAGDAGFDVENTCNDDLVAEATSVLRSVFGPSVPNPVESIVTRWASDKFARGSYSSAGPDMQADDYDNMARPVGNLFFAGEHTSATHPATVHGAYLTGLRAASEVFDRILGPIDIPLPLILPKDSSSSSLKRKAATALNPTQARADAHEIALWDHIILQIGLRPLKPAKPAMNAYLFYSKQHYEPARQKCEAGRRPGKGKASANEVRVMTAKMWRDCPAEERKPYEKLASEQKEAWLRQMEEFNRVAGEWDRRAVELKAEYEKEHPLVEKMEEEIGMGMGMGGLTTEQQGRRSKARVESYAESVGSDVDMKG